MVDLPEPVAPTMACVSPAGICMVMPLRTSVPSTYPKVTS